MRFFCKQSQVVGNLSFRNGNRVRTLLQRRQIRGYNLIILQLHVQTAIYLKHCCDMINIT